MNRWRHLDGPHARPFAVLAACIILLAAVDGGHGRFFSAATAYSTLQIFATISLVTLGLGLTMMIREFDLSVVGMYGMAGCIAVLTGTHHPWLGLWLALAIGLTAGIVQGFIIVRLHLSSVGVTLGGLLVFVGIAFVLTESRSLPYDNLGVAPPAQRADRRNLLHSQRGRPRFLRRRGGDLCVDASRPRHHRDRQ